MLFRRTPKQLPMRACLLLIPVSRALAILKKVAVYPGGLNVLHHSVKNPYSGTNYGLTVVAQGLGPSLRVWDAREPDIIMFCGRLDVTKMTSSVNEWQML